VTAFRALIGQAIYERESAKAILNTVIQPLVVLDAELRVQTANRAFHTMFGVSREESQGVALCEFGDDEWKSSGLWSALKGTLCGNSQFQTIEIDRAFPIGRRTVLLDARRLSQQHGGSNLILLAFQDITERKAADDALRQAKQAADEASRAKDHFLAVLSHELRTPLTPVVMAVAAMELNPDLPLNLRDDLTMIRRNVELESKLIDDLLDLSRITSGKLRLVFDRLDMNELIRRACDTCRPSIRMKGIHLHCDLDQNAHEIVGDPGRLQQVFWNLLNNAAKFTPEGGHIHVTTSNSGESQGDAMVRVTVRDTGIGMKPELLPRIFDAFQQGEDGTTRQFGGMGLGLTISKLLVEQHRGTIRADSDGSGTGSTFVVEVPALTSLRSIAPEPSPPATNACAAALRIMIVEDHADTAAILRKLLAAQGHSVNTATTAAAALALAREAPFDLIISDLGLPDMTGYDLMKQISEKHGIRGIAMSGYGMEEDIRKSEHAGFSDHLVKPLNMGQLEESIRRVTRGVEEKA